MINLKNYEEYALDYLEGNLSEEQRQGFKAFLDKQLEIKAELAEMKELVVVVPDNEVIFENKEALFKKETGAKVVMLSSRFWYRATAVVAAIGLLLIGYFLGYKTGADNSLNNQIVKETPVKKNDAPNQIERIINKEESLANENINENSKKETPKNENKLETPLKEAPKFDNQMNTQKDVFVKNDNSKMEKEQDLNNPKLDFQPNLDNPLKENKTIENKIQENAIANNSTKITPLSLPQKSLDIFKISLDYQIRNQAMALSEINLMNQNPEEAIVKTPESDKGYRIRDLFGRLPFEGVTKEAFIPSYFTEGD